MHTCNQGLVAGIFFGELPAFPINPLEGQRGEGIWAEGSSQMPKQYWAKQLCPQRMSGTTDTTMP